MPNNKPITPEEWRELTPAEVSHEKMPPVVRCVDCKRPSGFHWYTCSDTSRYEVPITPEEGKTVDSGFSRFERICGEVEAGLAVSNDDAQWLLAHADVAPPAPKTVDYEAEVKKVWPDAFIYYVEQTFSESILVCVVMDGVLTRNILGRSQKGRNGYEKDLSVAEAWQDAYSKIPVPSTTSEPAGDEPVCGLCGLIDSACEGHTFNEIHEAKHPIPPPTIGSEGALPPLDVNAADRARAGRTKRRKEWQVAEDLACRERQLLAALAKAPQAAPLDGPIPASPASRPEGSDEENVPIQAGNESKVDAEGFDRCGCFGDACGVWNGESVPNGISKG